MDPPPRQKFSNSIQILRPSGMVTKW